MALVEMRYLPEEEDPFFIPTEKEREKMPESIVIVRRNAEGKWEAVLQSGNREKVLFVSRNANKAQDYADEINVILNG